MNLKTIASAAIVAAGLGIGAGTADAKTNVDLFFGFGGGPSYYNDCDYGYGYGCDRRPHRSYYRRHHRPNYYYDDGGYNGGYNGGYRLSCGEVRQALRSRGWRNLEAQDCSGKTYGFTGWRRGEPFYVKASSRNGRVVSVRPL